MAEDLTPAARAEFAAAGVPHVAVVTHYALVEAASPGGGALVAALAGASYFGLTLPRANPRFERQNYPIRYHSNMSQSNSIIERNYEEKRDAIGPDLLQLEYYKLQVRSCSLR